MIIPLYDLNPHSRFPVITVLLIVANVWITWQTSRMPAKQQALVAYEHGFIPARLTRVGEEQPLRIRKKIEVRVLRGRQPQEPIQIERDLPNDSTSVYTSLLTSMFMHGGWLHLLSNMWMLWVFGNNIEDRLGHIVYGCFYIAGGAIAALSHWWIDPTSQVPMIGASGAVAAVLGGYALTYPWAKVKGLLFIGIPLLLTLPAFVFLGGWMLMETVAGILQLQLGVQVGVAHWAHIGGFVAGLILMPFLSMGRPPEGEDWNKETDKMFDFDDPRSPAKKEASDK